MNRRQKAACLRYACCAGLRVMASSILRGISDNKHRSAAPEKCDGFLVHRHRKPHPRVVDRFNLTIQRTAQAHFSQQYPHTFTRIFPCNDLAFFLNRPQRPASPVSGCSKGKPEHTDRNAHRHWRRRSRLWLRAGATSRQMRVRFVCCNPSATPAGSQPACCANDIAQKAAATILRFR